MHDFTNISELEKKYSSPNDQENFVSLLDRTKLWSYFHRFAAVLAGRVGGALSIFLVNLLLARSLGAPALGTYAIYVSLVAILSICLSLGFNSTASIFAAEYKTTGHNGLLKGYINTALKYVANSTLLLSSALLVVWLFLPDILPPNFLLFAFLVILTAIGASLLNLCSAVQVGLGRQVAGMLPETLLRPVLVGAVVFITIDSLHNIYWVMALSAAATWIALFSAYLACAKQLTENKSTSAQYDLKRWKKASRPWLATSLLWDYMIDLVLLITSLMAGAVEIAILHVCFRYRMLAGFGMRTIYLLLMPEITSSNVMGETGRLRRKIAQTNSASLFYSLAMIMFFTVFGEWLLTLFSLEFANAVPVLIIISLTMVIRAVFGPASLVLAVNNLNLATAAISLLGLLATIVMIVLFIGQFGLLAVAVAYSLSNLMVSVMLWIHAKNKTGIDSSIFALAKPAIA